MFLKLEETKLQHILNTLQKTRQLPSKKSIHNIGFLEHTPIKRPCMWPSLYFFFITGLYHEHNRPDRDDYVAIHEENITPKNKHNFDIPSNADERGEKYDFHSIMHYSKTAFSKNGLMTIEPHDKRMLDVIGRASKVRMCMLLCSKLIPHPTLFSILKLKSPSKLI